MSDETRATRRAAFNAANPIAKLPPAPLRENFPNQEQFEEALGYWQSHVGRIKAMADKHSKDSRSQIPDTPITTGKPAERVLSRPLPDNHPFFKRGFVVGQTVSMTMPPKKPKVPKSQDK